MNFFYSLIGMSGQATIVIGAILVLRFFFQKINISKKYVMLLWMIPFICLVIPWKISSPIGFWSNSPEDYMYTGVIMENEKIYSNIVKESATNVGADIKTEMNISVDANNHINMQIDTNRNENIIEVNTESKLEKMMIGAKTLWEIVVAILFLYSIGAYGKLKKQLRTCIQIRKNVFVVDDIPVPMVVGVIKPRIYIPSGIGKEHIKYVVAHEKTHIRRKDNIIKLVVYGITCIHWFNPLVWLSYNLMVKDMEMACDEETILRLGQDKKKDYATALLQLAIGKRNVFAIPLAFGEENTQERIKNVLKYKKTKRIFVVGALVTGVLVAVVFMTKDNSAQGGQLEENKNLEVMETIGEREDTENNEPETSINENNGKNEQTEKIEDSQVADAAEENDSTEYIENNQSETPTNSGVGEDGQVEETEASEAIDTTQISQEAEGAENEETEMWVKENNMLTEEQLAWFNTSFFNNSEGNYMANMFLTSKYDRPEDINFSSLFYNGTKDGNDEGASQEEKQLLEEQYNEPMDLDIVKTSVQSMDQVLQKYMNLTFDETTKTGLEGLYYLEEYEAYYNLAGDSLWSSYDILSGWVNEDKTITVEYLGRDTYSGEEGTWQVTLKEENGNYYFISNKNIE